MSINKSTDTIKLQTGLHLYKTGRSQYWYVRILIPKTKKRISRSTEETSRVEAKKVAYEIYSDFMTKPTKYSKIDAPNLFNCQFYPSCSNYGASAIRQYGLVRGGIVASERITRCNPFAVYYHLELNRPFYELDGRLIDIASIRQAEVLVQKAKLIEGS